MTEKQTPLGESGANNTHSNYTHKSVTIAIITSTTPNVLTKTYRLGGDGVKKETGGAMVEGMAQTRTFKNAEELTNILTSLAQNQALCYGLPPESPVKLLTKKEFEKRNRPSGYAARTDKHFQFSSGPGVLMVDYDPPKEGRALSSDEVLKQILKACPGLDKAQMVIYASASSYIYNSDTGEELIGARGFRIYIFVTDARDIPRAGRVLHERIILAGYGRIEISRSGALLERSCADPNVWQAHRLDFASGANCIAPLEQRRPAPKIIEGEIADTITALPELEPIEEAELATIREKLKAEVKPQADLIKSTYVAETVREFKHSALDDPDGTVWRAVEDNILCGDFPITLDDGRRVTIGIVLDDPAEYHGCKTLDPLEPEYHGNKVLGKLFLTGSRPTLHSFAHGGRTFKLIRALRWIEVVGGNGSALANQVIDFMQQWPDVFDFGGQLSTVCDGKIAALNEDRFAYWLGLRCQFWKHGHRKGERINIDPPVPVLKKILSIGAERQLKPLKAVITTPVITQDNWVVRSPGYSKKTGLFYDPKDDTPTIPDIVSTDDVRDAANELMHPFADFPFCSELDRAVFLSALMTAVLRSMLPTAPGFGIDSPVQGSGKSLLAACLGVLATGASPTVWSHAGIDAQETRKRILTAMVSGDGSVIWDNAVGFVDSPVVAAMLTSENFTDRILGKSESRTCPNRMLFVITGNNLTLTGDLPRRVFKCRIDPRTERPYARKFDLNPLEYVRRNRVKMAVAVIKIYRGHLLSTDYLFADLVEGGEAPGRMASFEMWDDMVRQPIAWINREVMPGNFGDVMEAVDTSQAVDPEQNDLSELLTELQNKFGDRAFSAKDIHDSFTVGTSFVEDDPLLECLSAIASKKNPSTKTIGRCLNFRVGRVAGGLVLRMAGKTNVVRWRVFSN